MFRAPVPRVLARPTARGVRVRFSNSAGPAEESEEVVPDHGCQWRLGDGPGPGRCCMVQVVAFASSRVHMLIHPLNSWVECPIYSIYIGWMGFRGSRLPFETVYCSTWSRTTHGRESTNISGVFLLNAIVLGYCFQKQLALSIHRPFLIPSKYLCGR